MIHHLKIWPGSFEAVMSGAKTHEIRDCSDRKFLVNDFVLLREWTPEVDSNGPTGNGAYTERQSLRQITYVSVPGSWGLPDNLCVFSIK